jgi:hypothetical protein
VVLGSRSRSATLPTGYCYSLSPSPRIGRGSRLGDQVGGGCRRAARFVALWCAPRARLLARCWPASSLDPTNFFANWPFSGFFPTNTPLTVSFQKMDPYLGAVIIGAELPCVGANTIGAYTSDVAVGWQ